MIHTNHNRVDKILKQCYDTIYEIMKISYMSTLISIYGVWM